MTTHFGSLGLIGVLLFSGCCCLPFPVRDEVEKQEKQEPPEMPWNTGDESHSTDESNPSVIIPADVDHSIQNPPDSTESLQEIVDDIKQLRAKLDQQLAADFSDQAWGRFAQSFRDEANRITAKISSLRHLQAKMIMSDALAWLDYSLSAAVAGDQTRFESDSIEYFNRVRSAERFIETGELVLD